MTKPNCYDCVHRRLLSGSAHSWCDHPILFGKGDDPLAAGLGVSLLDMSKYVIMVCMALEITGNTHGIRKGWFNWPYSYDPVWLNSCKGETPKEETKDG